MVEQMLKIPDATYDAIVIGGGPKGLVYAARNAILQGRQHLTTEANRDNIRQD